MAWLTNYGYRKKITLATSTYLAGDVTNDHAILVVQDSGDSDFWGNVKTDGEDVRFTSADETTELKYHFENFNHTTDDMVAWVKVVDTFDSGTDIDIYMYYGYGAASDGQDENNTYTAAYTAVWHMADATTQLDSTSNGWDITKTGTVSTQDTAKIDDGCTFTSAGRFSNATLGDNSHSAFSVTGWIKLTGGHEATSGNEYLVSKESGASNYMYISWHSDFGNLRFYCTTNGVTRKLDSVKTSWAEQWYFIVCSFITGTPGTLKIYVDSVLDNTKSETIAAMGAGTSQDWNVGAAPNAINECDGVIDELKYFQGSVLSLDEIKLIYRSENQDLQSYGAEEEPPVTGQYFNMKGYW